MTSEEFYNVVKNTKIETKNLILRPLKKTDAKSIRKYLQEKEISDNTMNIPYPYSLKDAECFINLTKKNLKKFMPNLELGVYHKQKKEVIGMVSLLKIDLTNNNAESGSWIGKPFWGSGLIHEAKIELYRFGFQKLKLRKIHSKVFSFNPRSFKHLEKLGFKRQGVFRQHVIKNKKYIDEYYYEMLKEEFEYNKLKKKLKEMFR
jgi:[ribosomal protein S5]-alanine N-acetyltransferase